MPITHPTTTTSLHDMQMAEAVKRMTKIGLRKSVIDEFAKQRRVYLSERINAMFDGILFWADQYDNVQDAITAFEHKHNSIVYHCQLTHTVMGDMLSLLYVSDSVDEWTMDNDDLDEGMALAYVKNLSDDDCSEFGSIGIQPKNGGITRTW